MTEILDFFKNKKNLIGLLFLGVLILGLFVGINLIRKQNIFKSRAAEEPIVFTGSNVRQEGGRWVVIDPNQPITVELKSPLGPPAGGGTGQSSVTTLGFLPELVKTAYAVNTCSVGYRYVAPYCPQAYEWEVVGTCGGCGPPGTPVSPAIPEGDCSQYKVTDNQNINPGTSYWCNGDFQPKAACSRLRVKDASKLNECAAPQSGGQCTISNRPKVISANCAVCLNQETKGETYRFIVSNAGSSFAGCSVQDIMSFWCDGGVGQGAKDDCIQKKSKCSIPCSEAVPTDTSGPATACNGNAPYQGNASGYAAWNGQCNGNIQAPGSLGIGQGCCEQACGASSQCDEQAAGQGNCNASCQYAPPVVATIAGWVKTANGAGVGGIKVWIRDEAAAGSTTCGGGTIPAACDSGKYKSVTTQSNGRFESQVTIGPHGYWVRIPDAASLGPDGASNAALFSSKQTTVPTSTQSYEAQAFNDTNKGCQTECNFTVSPVTTVSFRIAEGLTSLATASDQAYTLHGMTYSYLIQDKTPGIKTIFIQFKDSAGKTGGCGNNKTEPCQRQIEILTPSPVACTNFSPDLNRGPDKNVGGVLIPVYLADSAGINARRLNVTASSGVTVARPTVVKDPATAADLAFAQQQTGPDWFVDVPANTTTAVNEYTLSTTVTLAGQTATCPRFIIRVSAASAGGCECLSSNTCTSACSFTKLSNVSYASPIECSLAANLSQTVPTQADKNSWCNRSKRTMGDADGNGEINEIDYHYYLRAVSGRKIPPAVNPDFDGDGRVSNEDLTIWQQGRGQ